MAPALEFTILTAVRTSEAIGATWNEIDLDAGVWTIPASRMKAKRDHRVPLSDRAVEILRGKRIRNRQISFSSTAAASLVSNHGHAGTAAAAWPATATRFTVSDLPSQIGRVTARTIAADVIEQCLAHTIKDKSEAAYRRGDAIDKRRRLMDEWSRYCASPSYRYRRRLCIKSASEPDTLLHAC